MLSSALAKVSSHLPSGLKYRLSKLRPLYARILSSGRSVVAVSTQVGDIRWRIDELTCEGHLTGKYEPYMQEALSRLLRPEMTVYDVGAHAGFHALFCALTARQTIAFEPHPGNRTSIERQLSLNPRLNVRLMPYALSDSNGPGALTEPSNSSMAFVSSDGEIPVELRTLDSLVAQGLPAPDLIKMDVEGHELSVLRGGADTIRNHNPIILCDRNDENTSKQLWAMLAEFNYRVTGEFPVTCLPQDKRDVKAPLNRFP